MDIQINSVLLISSLNPNHSHGQPFVGRIDISIFRCGPNRYKPQIEGYFFTVLDVLRVTGVYGGMCRKFRGVGSMALSRGQTLMNR